VTAVTSQSSPPKSPSSVVKPHTVAADVDAGPLYSGYALTPGILYSTVCLIKGKGVLYPMRSVVSP